MGESLRCLESRARELMGLRCSYAIVFISNQAGAPKQQQKFKDKVPLIGETLKVPFHLFAAFERDQFRKPAPGMWDLYVEDYNEGIAVGESPRLLKVAEKLIVSQDYEQSFFVGDAAGRPAGPGRRADHGDSDRSAFSRNVCRKLR